MVSYESEKNSMRKYFGYQLIVDLYGCTKEVCNDYELLYDFLNKIVDFLGMQKQTNPTVIVSNKNKYPDKEGLSGWVPLIESSVVVHTLSKKGFISIDVYSCKEFDREKAISFIGSYFDPKEVETKNFFRGERYYEG